MSYDPYATSNNEELLGGLLVVGIILLLIVALISYVIGALIYFKTAKTNGYEDIAFLAWIPLVNFYLLFLFAATGSTEEEKRASAKKNIIIYIALFVVSFIPLIGLLFSLGMMVISVYMMYRLLYRWSGDKTRGILFTVCTIVTSGIFFLIYGLMRMNRPFRAE
ncbi:MAG: hypothetical protein RR595_02525 [Lysinibacillus sp.]